MSEPSTNPQEKKREKAAPLLGCYDDLDGSCAHAWALLARGVKDRRSPFHTPGLATVSPEGLPEIRTVVLRGCDPQTRNLRFHTDTRSAKIADMQKQPQAALHFYDPGAKIQLRVRARLELLTGEAHASAWDNTRPMSRECYQVTQAPGSPCPHRPMWCSMRRPPMTGPITSRRLWPMCGKSNGCIWPRAATGALCLISQPQNPNIAGWCRSPATDCGG